LVTVSDTEFTPTLVEKAGRPRELAESLTRATQPGLVSPGGSEQSRGLHPASLLRIRSRG